MKTILILVTWYLYWIQIVNSRKVRVIAEDDIYPYTIQKGVKQYTEYYSTEHLILEQIDDDQVNLGGYVLWTKSLDHSLPIKLDVRTQFLHQSTWVEGPMRLNVPTICSELPNPSRLWYNFTKLWTNCPPRKGEKFLIESQIVDVQFIIPLSMPLGKWKFHCLLTQGLLGAINKFGWMFQVELIEVV